MFSECFTCRMVIIFGDARGEGGAARTNGTREKGGKSPEAIAAWILRRKYLWSQQALDK